MKFRGELDRLLRHTVGVIAPRLPREDVIAFLDLLCEFYDAHPDNRLGYMDRFEPYLSLVEPHEMPIAPRNLKMRAWR